MPVTMEIQPDGDVHVKIGSQMETLINRVRFESGYLSGSSYRTIPSGDARSHPHNIGYRLLLSGMRLSGYVDTETTGGRSYGNFSSYLRLEKAAPPK